MKPRMFISAGMLAVALTSPALAQDSALAARPVVTIAQFDTGRTGWVPPPGFGATLAELLGERLVASGRYRVLDSEFLTRDLANAPGWRVALETLRERADQAGVQYLVLGSLTEFSREERQRSGGGAAVLGTLVAARFHAPVAPMIGGARSASIQSVLAVSIRVIDVRTGEIVASASGQGLASRTNRSATGIGLIRGAPLGGGFSSSSSGASDAMLNEALQDALDEVGDVLARTAPRLIKSSDVKK